MGTRDQQQARIQDRDGDAGSVTARSSGCATFVALAQGDEFELQGEAATNPEREQGTEGGQKREHADDGMTAAPEILCFLGFLEF